MKTYIILLGNLVVRVHTYSYATTNVTCFLNQLINYLVQCLYIYLFFMPKRIDEVVQKCISDYSNPVNNIPQYSSQMDTNKVTTPIISITNDNSMVQIINQLSFSHYLVSVHLLKVKKLGNNVFRTQRVLDFDQRNALLLLVFEQLLF